MAARSILFILFIFSSCCGMIARPFSNIKIGHHHQKSLHKHGANSIFDKIHSVDKAMAILERLRLSGKRHAERDETDLKDGKQVSIPPDDGLALNSDPVRPALGLEDKAILLRIRSYLKAIRSQLDDIDQAERTRLKAGDEGTRKTSANRMKLHHASKAMQKDRKLTRHRTTSTPAASENVSSLLSSTTSLPSITSKTKITSSRSVGVREVSKSSSTHPIKHQITDSIIKAFGVIKLALIEFDRDVERHFRHLNNVNTDHFNMVDGDVKSNGDNIDRLKKYVVEDLNSCRASFANLTGVNELHRKETQNNIEQIKNITQSLLNITRVINDRTERISEIKERELKLALAREQLRKTKTKSCTKHHCKKKGKGPMSKHGQKKPNILQKVLSSKKLTKPVRSRPYNKRGKLRKSTKSNHFNPFPFNP